MTCYFRHLQHVFKKAGIEVTKENKRIIDRMIHGIVDVEYKKCPAAWKEVKKRIAEDEEGFIFRLNGLGEVKSVKWKKPSQQLIELFDDVVPEDKGVDRRKMFGYPCAFKNGNMFMGLHQDNIFLRLSKEDREEFLKLDQASQFEPMPKRIMKEYIVVPSWMLKNAKELEEWISKSLVYVSSLPAKLRKKRKRAKC